MVILYGLGPVFVKAFYKISANPAFFAALFGIAANRAA